MKSRQHEIPHISLLHTPSQHQVSQSLSILPQTQLLLSHIFQVIRPVIDGDRKMSSLGNFQPAKGMLDSYFAKTNLKGSTGCVANTSMVQQWPPVAPVALAEPRGQILALGSFGEANTGWQLLATTFRNIYKQLHSILLKKAKKQPQSYAPIVSNHIACNFTI